MSDPTEPPSKEIVLSVEGIEFHADSSEDEPRVLDVELGRRAGMAQPLNVRTVIKKARESGLLSDSEVLTRSVKTSSRGGRPSTEYWLTEAGAMILVTQLRTPAAVSFTRTLVRAYREAVRQLREPPALPPPPAVPMLDVTVESGPRMGDTTEGRDEVRRRIEVTARACMMSVRRVQGFVRRVTRTSSPYFVGAIHWRLLVLPLLDELAMGRVELAPRRRKPGPTNSKQTKLWS